MKRFVLLALVGLSIVFAGAACADVRSRTLPEATIKACRIENIPVTFSCSGRINAAKTQSVCLTSASMIRNIRVNVGDHVIAGETLFFAGPLKEYTEYGVEDFLSTALKDADLLKAILTGEWKEIQASISMPDATEVFSMGNDLAYASPISGVVTAINVRENGIALPGIACVTVCDLTSMEATMEIPETHIHKLKLGQNATVYIRGANKRVSGIVTMIPSEVRTSFSLLGESESTATATIALSGTEKVLPGMSCTAKITVETLENVMTVSYEALREDSSGNYYLYTTDGKTVHILQVTLGEEMEDRVVVYTSQNEPFYYLTSLDKEWTEGQRIYCCLEEEK